MGQGLLGSDLEVIYYLMFPTPGLSDNLGFNLVPQQK